MKLTENLRLVRMDQHNIVLEHYRLVQPRRGQSGEPTMKWMRVSYHGNVVDAARSALRSQAHLTAGEAEDIEDFIERMEAWQEELTSNLRDLTL